MDRQVVGSTNIRAIGYDDASETLEVEFLNGSRYQYYGVPSYMHEQMMREPSKGPIPAHLHQERISVLPSRLTDTPRALQSRGPPTPDCSQGAGGPGIASARAGRARAALSNRGTLRSTCAEVEIACNRSAAVRGSSAPLRPLRVLVALAPATEAPVCPGLGRSACSVPGTRCVGATEWQRTSRCAPPWCPLRSERRQSHTPIPTDGAMIIRAVMMGVSAARGFEGAWSWRWSASDVISMAIVSLARQEVGIVSAP